ncbi:hypothetical protein MPNT_10309 [Candidatus Methylacidithermus pantelleriae]|uniref:Uncharacterized protein n=2 Tax=Candidatus Methylacidithermus pantelleriae TaxID=2744239 RepID=A0A8J2BLV8_9BACT|nr:hypothetical protein MPNT_10309 [Candidatus Methylacidithermus pantelleriae]
MALVLVALFWLGNGVAWGKANPGGSKKSYPYHFFCTLYYLPKEEGFSASRGFDVRPVRAPGLGAHPYPASFLWAVRMEGAGRIRTPVRGFHYIRYAGGGSYEYCSAPTAANGHRLQAHRTCAISSRNPYLRLGQEIEIDSPTVRAVFGSSRWRIEDTGGGLNPWQIDLYWGEDEPRGSEGRDRNRPKGTDFEYAFDVIVTVLGQG